MSDDLKNQFETLLLQMCDRSRDECGYNPVGFRGMITQYGGFGAACNVLNAKHMGEGLTRLWEEDRLDLTVEWIVREKPWCTLFTSEQLATAESRINQLQQNKYRP